MADRLRPGVPGPRPGGACAACHPAESVRNDAPPKHRAASEIPVVYDTTQRQLHYFEKTPMWGAAYYKGFRKQIGQFLG